MAKSAFHFLLLAAYWLTLTQAAPAHRDLLGINQPTIKRSERPVSSSPHDQLAKSMYDCWEGAGDIMTQQSMKSEACNKMMKGKRSSANATIPQGSDTVEMFISTATKSQITHDGHTYRHAVELVFNVSAIYETGDIYKTEVRIFHTAVQNLGCNIQLKLVKVNVDHDHPIDQVDVDFGLEGWVIFDNVNYSWKTMEEAYEHTVAIIVTGTCKHKSLTDLGFRVDSGRQPILVVFSSQEQVTTEVSILPPSFVETVLSSVSLKRDVEGAPVKRNIEIKKGCDIESYTVNLADIGLTHILFPTSINMKRCVGQCRFPVPPNSHNSLYAAFLARAAWKLGNEHHPSCVPVAFNKVTLLYKPSYTTNIVQKAEVSASQCGCR